MNLFCEIRKKIITVCICTAVLLQCLCFPVFAETVKSFETERLGSILLSFPYDLAGIEFTMVKVGEVSDAEKGCFELLSEFGDTKVNLNECKTAKEQKDAAQACLRCVLEKKIEGTSLTPEAGDGKQLLFPDVETGVYLIYQKEVESDKYLCEAFLVQLPSWNQTENGWIYEMEASPKAEEKPAPGKNPNPGTTQNSNPGTTQKPSPGTTQKPNPGTTQKPSSGITPSQNSPKGIQKLLSFTKPKTGDPTNIYPSLILMVGSLIGIFVVIRRKKHNG